MRRGAFFAALFCLAGVVLGTTGCKQKTVAEAERTRDVPWLVQNGAPEAIAAVGRLADTDPAAVAALENRRNDVNAYIAAWGAVQRNAPWGLAYLRAGLADPSHAEMAASALPRRDPRLVPLAGDLETAVVRLSAGRRGSVVAGVLASVGPQAHAHVERRLIDPKTRGAMCDGIGIPDASGDAKSVLLAVPPEARDHESCVTVLLGMAATEDVVLGWLATGAEPGLLTAAAKSTLPCSRLATIWSKALVSRPPESFAALAVPLQLSIRRCASTLDPILSDVLTKAPRSRACVLQAIDPFGGELADLKTTCTTLKQPWVAGETPRIRERARDAVAHGCRFAQK